MGTLKAQNDNPDLHGQWQRTERLMGRMLDAVRSELPPDGVAEVRGYLDANEFGLAMDSFAELVMGQLQQEIGSPS